MSIIAITVPDSIVSNHVLMATRSFTGSSIEDIRKNIKEGLPVFEKELFDNKFDENSGKLKEFIAEIERVGAEILIKEDGYTISSEILKNILNSAKEIGDETEDEFN